MDNRSFKKKIITGISHHLNNPLAIIRGSAEMIGMRHEETQSDVNRILAQVDRLSETVKSLRLYSEEMSMEKNTSLTEIMERVTTAFPESSCRLDIAEDIKVASGLYFAIFNLVQNAVEARGEKEVTVNVWAKDDKIHIKIENQKKVNLDQLTTPFSTSKNLAKNLGLGYNISHDIIVSLEGQIKVSNETHTVVEVIVPI